MKAYYTDSHPHGVQNMNDSNTKSTNASTILSQTLNDFSNDDIISINSEVNLRIQNSLI